MDGHAGTALATTEIYLPARAPAAKTSTGQAFDDRPGGDDLLGVDVLASAVVSVHCRGREDAQVPTNVALCAEWGGGKSFAKRELRESPLKLWPVASMQLFPPFL